MLICFAGEASGLDPAGVFLRPDSEPVRPPLSWHRLATARGPALLLLCRAQPCVRPGAALELGSGDGRSLRLRLGAPAPLDALAGGLPPSAVQELLRFIAAKATGILRHSEDDGLAEACHRVAEAVMAPDRCALPVALCGHDMVMWALPRGVTAEGACYALSRRRLRRVTVSGGVVALRDRQFEGGYLLAPDGGGPIHLAPAGGPLPSLAELGRRKDARSRAWYRSGLAELSRRAAADPEARRRLRDLQLLLPTGRPHHLAQPDRPLGASLEMAVCDHGGGVFLRGWIRDPLGLVAALALRGPHGEQPLPMAALERFGRPDLAEQFAGAPHGGAGPKPGFALHLPEAARRPVAQWSLRVALTTGDSLTLVAPPAIMHPQGARDAVLSAIAPAEVTPALMERCIAPAVERLHRAALAGRPEPEVVRIGTPPRAPAASIVVPLYRNLRFLRPQYASFARDPSLGGAELIYVLDSPEQRREVEHLLRGLHGLYARPLTLLVQGGNYGYAAACNAGAAAAQGGVLVMLNSDVVPAARGWIRPLLGALARRRLAAVGPKLLFEDGSLQHAGLFFERGPEGEWHNSHYWKGCPRHFPPAQRARPVPAVTGAALCVRRAAFEAVGGFSTDYVIGDYEDSDLCLKLREAGGEIAYVPGAELYHFERQSIRDHAGYARTLAAAYNRRLHHRRWSEAIARLMARGSPHAAREG
ncbi:glycosyltransferase [Crenalkalicoccus roseus]|uniref:glycosyltransferase n=1 Tax=Crenalkalicoccus roseus TaxID=1485588 RepID=UPI0010817B23|nr:glycosyltransferase [Crenalkalicoccus roseus]